MGSYSTLKIGNLRVLDTKWDWEPEVMTLFTEADKIVMPYKEAVEISEDEDEDYLPEYYFAYSAPLNIVKDRLELMGYTLRRVRQTFDTLLEEELENMPDFNGEKQEVLSEMTLDRWIEGLKYLDGHDLISKYLPYGIPQDVRKEYEKLPQYIQYMLRDRETGFYGFPTGDLRMYFRAAIEALGDDAKLTYDFTELLGSGDVSSDDNLCEHALESFAKEFVSNYKIIVLTEGATDRSAIQSALQLLYPHLADYYSFMDFDSAKVMGGAGHLASTVKSFVGVGIVNRVVAFFDNDTAAKAAMRPLKGIKLPNNMRILHYPDIEIAKNYPTLGPQGPVSMDVNGLACSLELYYGLDVLREEDGSLCPIQWRGYDDAIKQYQGEVMRKEALKIRYAEKLSKCQADPELIGKYDWSGMEAIIQSLLTAFHED
jgi:hypothetical protein